MKVSFGYSRHLGNASHPHTDTSVTRKLLPIGSRGRKAGLSRLEAIAVLINRRQSPAVLAGEVQLLAQAADVGIDRARADVRAEVPDVFQQRIAADDAPLTAEQVAGELVFALSQFDLLARHADAAALR